MLTDHLQNPSGSSSGPAVGVSAGYAPLSIGTETDGSLVCPAGRAALYALKPTIGIIDTAGIVPVSHSFDAPGPITKTPYDLALLLDVLVQEQPQAQKSYTSALTRSWSDISIATLDPEEWKFPSEILKPVQEATDQIVGLHKYAVPALIDSSKNREIRSAYAKIQTQTKAYVDNASLISFEEFGFHGNYSKEVVTS